MEMNCPLCGKVVSLPDDLAPGQHVRCPHCGKKFSVGGERTGICEETLRIALEVALKDPEKSAYYENAPEGARLFIALMFYGSYFRETVDVASFMSTWEEVGATLKRRDLEYLLRFETDAEIRQYLTGRLQASGGAEGGERKPKLGLIRETACPRVPDVGPALQEPVPEWPDPARTGERVAPRNGRIVPKVLVPALIALAGVLAWVLIRGGGEPAGSGAPKPESPSGPATVRAGNAGGREPDGIPAQAADARTEALEAFRTFLSRERTAVEGVLKESTEAYDEILNDQKRLSEVLIRLEAENARRAKVALTNGWLRFDKAEMVMMVLKDRDMNDLAIKYLGEDFSALRADCRSKIKAALEMQSFTAKRLAENRAKYRKQLEGIEEEVDRKTSKAQELTAQANRDLEARLADLENARAKKELELKRLKAIDRKSSWLVREQESVQEEVCKLAREISRVGEIVAVSRGNVAHIAATAAETAARRKGDAALGSRQDDDNAVHAEMAHVRTVFGLAADYEGRSLDKICASMRSRKDLLSSKVSDAQKKLDFILQSSANADLLQPDEIERLRKGIVERLEEKVLDKLQ